MRRANTLKTAVACALLGAAAATAPASSAHAQPQFDKKIAKFMADKAAGMLGELRDGYAIDEAPDLSRTERTLDYRIKETLSAGGMELLSPAVDGTTTGGIGTRPYLKPRTDIRVVYAG